MRRENTFKIDLSQLAVKPSVEKLYNFCRSILGLKREEIKRLQRHRGGACAFIKVSDLTIAQKVVEEHDGKHEVECDGKKHKLRITLEDGSVEVRVFDLSEDVGEEKVVEFLSAFGEVISIREVLWSECDEAEVIPLGVWSARMLVKRNIDSWVNIDGEQAFVEYKGQLQSCRHCKEQAHTGISCVQNKKLLYQKSYANVTKQSGQTNRSTTGQRPQKPSGARPSNTKPAGQKSAAAPPLSSVGLFPALPSASSQGGSSGTAISSSEVVAAAVSSQNQRAQNPSSSSSTSFLAPPQASVLLNEIFRKPRPRPKSKSGNGNETDESTTSTTSRTSQRSRNKKTRPNDPTGDDMDAEEEEGIKQ